MARPSLLYILTLDVISAEALLDSSRCTLPPSTNPSPVSALRSFLKSRLMRLRIYPNLHRWQKVKPGLQFNSQTYTPAFIIIKLATLIGKSQIMCYSLCATNSHVKPTIAKTKKASGKRRMTSSLRSDKHCYIPQATCPPHTKAHTYPSANGQFHGLPPD